MGRGSQVLIIALSLFLAAGGTSLAGEPLRLGIHPYLSSTELIKRFTPLADHLGSLLGRQVMIQVSTSYDSHIEKIAHGGIDIAYLGPASYVKLTGRYGPFPILAVHESNGRKTFRGHIITRKDSAISSLSQLKGKRFAFGDPDSTMSHLVPRSMLLKSGVDVSRLAEARFLANHENIALGVLAGDFDAGAVKEEIFREYESRGLRVLAVSPPVNDHLFVARKDLPQKTIQAVRAALVALKHSGEGKRILSAMRSDLTALVPGEDRDYDSLRSIMHELRQAGVEP
jgi:phosphonate transport system substrate-binding protein